MTNSKPKICLEHLIKIYGEKPHTALKLFREGKSKDYILQATLHVLGIADVSLTVNQGELFVVMGLSGSGKSTLVRCINRLIHPTSGHIYIDDEDVAHANEKRMREIRLTKVSMVFQRFGLFPHKTVVQNVEYGLLVRGVDKASRRQKALETLDLVGLAQWASYLPDSLSGGMQQRVGLARALATDTEILLMDEPFSALDPLIRLRILIGIRYYRELCEMEKYDYIVIGAGSAGSIVASKLAAYDSRISILLIEAGETPNNLQMWTPSDWFEVLQNYPEIEWGYQSVPQPNLNKRCIKLAQAKVLGGCALHNGMVYVRGSISDFNAWGKVAPGWSWNDVLPHFEEVEQTMKVTTGEADDFINNLFTAANQYGLPYNPNYNTSESQHGYAQFQFNVTNSPNLTRQTTYSTFQPDRYENITVLSGASVTRIIFKGSVAVGIEYIKDCKQNLAYVHKEVILSAGAIASPKILMLSGVGDENELKEVGISVVANVPEVGKNFHDDLFVSAGFYITSKREPPFYTYGLAPAVIFGSTKNSSSVIDVEISVGVGTLKGFSGPRSSFWLWPNIMHLKSKGTVTLRSSNPDDLPLVNPGYLTASGDIEKCKKALELGIDIGNQPGLNDWRPKQCAPEPGQDLESYIRETADTTQHYCGTCRMGSDENSVVDTELKVRSTSGLRVIDSSVFPLPITANTAAATMMIANKGTDIIIRSL